MTSIVSWGPARRPGALTLAARGRSAWRRRRPRPGNEAAAGAARGRMRRAAPLAPPMTTRPGITLLWSRGGCTFSSRASTLVSHLRPRRNAASGPARDSSCSASHPSWTAGRTAGNMAGMMARDSDGKSRRLAKVTRRGRLPESGAGPIPGAIGLATHYLRGDGTMALELFAEDREGLGCASRTAAAGARSAPTRWVASPCALGGQCGSSLAISSQK